jgi:hypothetical protein
LLVTAAKKSNLLVVTGRSNIEPSDKTLNQAALRLVIDELRPREPWQDSHRNVGAHAGPKDEPGGFSILRRQSDTGAHGLLGASYLNGAILHENLSRIWRRTSEYAEGHFTASRPDQSGHADDFSLADLETHVAVLVTLRQAANLKHHLLARRRLGFGRGGAIREQRENMKLIVKICQGEEL